MLKNARAQMIAVAAISGILGYVAASSKLDVFRAADAAPSQQRIVDKDCRKWVSSCDCISARWRSTRRGRKRNVFHESRRGTCCASGSAKGQLVAMANLNAATAHLAGRRQKAQYPVHHGRRRRLV